MMMDAFVLLVLHASKIATVSYTVRSTYEGEFDSPSHTVTDYIYIYTYVRNRNYDSA